MAAANKANINKSKGNEMAPSYKVVLIDRLQVNVTNSWHGHISIH